MKTLRAALVVLGALPATAAAQTSGLSLPPEAAAERFGMPSTPVPVSPAPLQPVLPGAPALIDPAPSLPSPADEAPATTPPAQAGREGGVDPNRFGKLPDDAYGAFQRGLYMTAYNLALPRARNGDPAAQTLLAELLSRGLGIPRREAEAAKWYAAAAEQGVPEAQFQYALMLLDGNFVPRDTKGAYALMQAAAEAGNRLAQFNLAQMTVGREMGPEGMARAVSYYERAAEAGLGDAQYAMSQIYANGVGGKPKDDVKARHWLSLAARANFDTAQLDLATWLIEGRGGTRDAKVGFAWMKRAAEAGNVAAQSRLGKLYMQGIGVDPDTIDAAAWYFIARRAGLIDPVMQDFLDGLTDEEKQKALTRANRLR